MEPYFEFQCDIIGHPNILVDLMYRGNVPRKLANHINHQVPTLSYPI